MKTKVTLRLNSLSIPQKIQNLRIYAANLIAFPTDFPNPYPSPNKLLAAANKLEMAYSAAQNGGKKETAALHEKEKIADAAIIELSHYIEDIPTCTPDLVKKLGMNVRPSSGKRAVIFNIKKGDAHGEVILRTATVKGAAYEFEFFKGTTVPGEDTPPNQGWQHLGISTKRAAFFASGLQMEVKYWFRVRPIVGQTKGNWEKPLSIILLP